MRSGFGRVCRAPGKRGRASPRSIGYVRFVEWPVRGTGSAGVDSADERVPEPEPSGRHGVGAPRRHRELEPEGAASARLTLQAHVSAHQRHELAADRQAEPGASVDAGGAVVPLREALEEPCLAFRRDPDTRVDDAHADHHVRGRSPQYPASTVIAPLSVNLTALPTRLTSVWRTRTGSPFTCAGTSGSITQVSDSPFALAAGTSRPAASTSVRRRSMSTASMVSFPASILEASRMSLMMASSPIAAARTRSRFAR